MTLTIAILTKNEESNIEECINTVKSFGNIVVIDSQSTDTTKEIAESMSVKTVDFVWNRRYPRKKQWVIENLKENDWIMLLDADERPTEEFLQEVVKLTKQNDFVAARCRLDQYIYGHKLRFGHKDSKVFLINRIYCKYPDVETGISGYGDIEFHYQPFCDGKVYKMKNRLQHKDNDSLASWMTRHIRYAQIENEISQNRESFKEVIRHKNLAGRIYYRFGSNPILFFIYSYIFRLGFLDGISGFIMIFLKSWYYVTVRILKRERLSVEK